MADLIEHCGVVERTERDTVYVRITSRSACGTCKARQACGLAEAQHEVGRDRRLADTASNTVRKK